MGEFRVSDKEPTKKGSTNNRGIGSGVKVQSLEAFTNSKMTMMLNHNHHHRPLDNDDDDDAGPTTYMSFSGSSSAPLGAAIDGCGAAVIRPPLQPFDISAYTSATTTTLKSPAAGGMAASSLGFPFTGAQWKELQRQAMIYKYMMASVPVPSDLLIPTAATTTTSSVDGGFNLRLSSSSSTDPEPGRCRRTDGKKWRCSRDVAPNNKYCERHMHRGRPRSRKPVEVHPNNNHQIKRARHDSNPNFPVPDVTVAIPNPTTRKDGSSSHFLASTTSHPYFQPSLSLDNNFGVKGLNFGSVASVSSNKQPRGLEWMLNGDPISLGASDSGWQSLMHNKVATNTGGSCNNTEPQYLNSLALYSYGLDQQDRRLPMFLNPLVAPMESFESEKPRGFIDAWSNSEAGESNANANTNTNANNKNSAAASIGKLSLSSLDLSMGGGVVHEEEMGNIGMGLGLMGPDGNTHTDDTTKISLSNWLNPAAPWVVASTPGGPLAEVLRPSTVTATSDATSNQSSPVITSGPLGTMASSPSGVLHKTFASLSDSSGNSSPTVASSRVNSEIALLKFNQM